MMLHQKRLNILEGGVSTATQQNHQVGADRLSIPVKLSVISVVYTSGHICDLGLTASMSCVQGAKLVKLLPKSPPLRTQVPSPR